MASLWKLEDYCLSFLAQTLKTYKDPLTDEMVESLNAVFKTNHGTGDVLFRFTDEEWKELIPAVCLRVHVRDAFKRVIQNDEKAALSQLHRKGLSKKPVSEVTQMVPVPRITSFFRSLSVLALPDHDYLSSLPVDPCLPVESVNIVDLESVTKLIQQNQHLHSMRERNFSSRLMRKVICTFFSLNDNNIRHAATKLTTALSHPASGSDSDGGVRRYAPVAPPNRALVPAGQVPHGRDEQEAATARGVAPRGEARPREPPRVRSRRDPPCASQPRDGRALRRPPLPRARHARDPPQVGGVDGLDVPCVHQAYQQRVELDLCSGFAVLPGSLRTPGPASWRAGDTQTGQGKPGATRSPASTP